jgi:outer membrane protein OmpA-like peptidoglycan-associated protein
MQSPGLKRLLCLGLVCWFAGPVALAKDTLKDEEVSDKVLGGGCLERTFESFLASQNNVPKESAKLQSQFFRAVSLQQCAAEASPTEQKRMLEEAEGLYTAFLISKPESAGAANNLAKVYEQLGKEGLAGEMYKRAAEHESPRTGIYLQNYAAYLDRTGQWNKASELYLKSVRELPLSNDEREQLASRFAEQGIDELLRFLWELIDFGGSRNVADMALEATAKATGESAESRMELLAILTVGLSRWEFNETQYLEDGLHGQLLYLSGDPVIGKGISEVVKLYDLTRRIHSLQGVGASIEGFDCGIESLCQQLEPSQFPWWGGLTPHSQNPQRGIWPVNGFRALVRSLGEQMMIYAEENSDQDLLSAEYYRFAESYLTLAAKLQTDEVDSAAVRGLVQLKFETEAEPDVEQVRAQYEPQVEHSVDTLEREGAFEYHKTLAEYYSYLNNEGDADAAKSALHQLQQAKLQSDELNACADNKEGELPGKYCFTKEMEEMLERACNAAKVCKLPTLPPPASQSHYIGDDIRIGLGYTSETDFTGEFFWNFLEDSDSASSFEGWKGDDSSGGLKLNFHWLADGVVSGQDSAGKPIYSDGKVRKLFFAWDQNVFSDGKISFGGGSERENRFWSLYGSKSVTGERATGQTINIQTMTQEGFTDNHVYIQTDTLTTTTDYLAHPYDWGIGFRVGRYFEDNLIRLRGGFDYEDGDYSSYQLSGHASIDKRFLNSSQGLSLRAEIIRKHGDFETDKSDLRVSAFWSWDFGTSSRTSVQGKLKRVERIPNPSELPRESFTRMVGVQKTLPFSLSFAYDDYELTDSEEQLLDKEIEKLKGSDISGKILVIGHTCSRGTDEYNQVLSQQRAQAVADFLQTKGVETSIICPIGRGEEEPKYSNETEESRERNRRVEVSFVVNEPVTYENIVGEGQPIIEWAQDEAPAEAAWIRRALRNPVSHKRTVDYYRYNRVTEQHETERELINEGPVADNDDYTVQQDSTNNPLSVLDNDSDPEYDNLKIVAVSNPAHGTVTISGNMLLYTPYPGFYGTDSFSYEIEDVFVTEPHPPGPASTAHVSINVIATNEPPVAVDDAYEVVKNSSDNRFDVLVNDSDPDGDVLTITGTGTPANGTVTFTGDTILYTPNEGYHGEDRFDYTITDGKGGEATAWVTVTIVNRPPVAVNDRGQTWKNTSVVIDVLANDFDPDGDPLTIVAIIQDEHPMGIVVDNGDGTLTYTPMRGWWGGDSFQYTISDGEQTSTATVTLKVINNIWD